MIRIGISACIQHEDDDRDLWNGRPLLFVEQSMATWLLGRGARAYMVPFAPEGADTLTPREMVEGLDGLVLQGGADVAPSSYGDEPLREEWSGDAVRDGYELELVEACLDRGLPVLGVCRGLQVLNVALGGTLYQDIPTQVDSAICHRDPEAYDQNRHRVDFEPDSRLAALYAEAGYPDGAEIVSVHHQAVDRLADGLAVEARSPEDGIIEAARLQTDDRADDDRWAAGIQWHPEFQAPDASGLLPTAPLLDDFLEAVGRRA